MKRVLLLVAFCSVCFAANEAEFEAKYTDYIKNIKETRLGLSEDEISAIKDLFDGSSKQVTAVDKNNVGTAQSNSYDLRAICGKKAKIDGKWYKIGDEINGYKLNSINSKGAVLSNGSQTLNINLNKGGYNVIISK